MSKTSFVTIKILDLYNKVSHVLICDALGRFLSKVLDTGRYQKLSIDTITQLTEIVLHNNIFTYNGNIYRHIKGSPLSLSLTRTLCNIYLYDWQSSFIGKLAYNEEFYGRLFVFVVKSFKEASYFYLDIMI